MENGQRHQKKKMMMGLAGGFQVFNMPNKGQSHGRMESYKT